MRNKLRCVLAAGLALTVLTSCGSSITKGEVSKALGISVSSGAVMEESDSTGWFGDGIVYIVLNFSDQTCLDEIREHAAWQPLPLSDTAAVLAYGDEHHMPYLTEEDQARTLLLPEIENGYYYYENRSPESAAYIANFTLAIYNTDTDTLYYCKYNS